ncbi:CYTH domain-containing protein [Neisseria sp. 74A18]|uniref:CYTH domain-containing protein n=1 Tax=Neisseria sp. 74A18 TaxID=1696094 RepID=UPI0006CAE6A0|nr:CYTH domain-containing protein [Neisseria sp. 74A18]KPN73138.1 adenylate cyclase [Neisseria sp. 74A18]
MTIEIERRFLLKNDSWREEAGEPEMMRQGYLSVDKECTIRVRIVGRKAWLALKGYISDTTRSEFEYEIPVAHAEQMMQTMCPFKLEKHRYKIEYRGFMFEIDEYFGDNAPLVVAELELPGEGVPFEKPDWLGEEITSNGKFTNAYLSKHPYSQW